MKEVCGIIRNLLEDFLLLNIYAALFYFSNKVKVRILLKKIVALKKATIITTTFF